MVVQNRNKQFDGVVKSPIVGYNNANQRIRYLCFGNPPLGANRGNTAVNTHRVMRIIEQAQTMRSLMFEGSYGSVSATVCTSANIHFSPQSKQELQNAIDECLKLPEANCRNGPHGSIGEWDVSSVTDMSRMFSSKELSSAAEFNGNISKWDVSRVQNMFGMFWGAASFNSDLSE